MAMKERRVARGAGCVSIALGAALCMLSMPVAGMATAPLGCGSTTAPATVCPPLQAQPSGSAVVNPDGTVTVTVQGEYDWYTQILQRKKNGKPVGDACGGEYGIGWSMIWHDPKDPGAMTVASDTVAEGLGAAGNSLNPPDAVVHYNADDPCGTPQDVVDPQTAMTHTIPAGQWGLGTAACLPPDGADVGVPACPPTPAHPSTAPTLPTVATTHTYASPADLPSTICVNLYVLQHPYVNDDAAYTLAQPDNSITAGEFDPTPGNGSCFTPLITPAPVQPPGSSVQPGTLAGHIFICGSKPPREVRGGHITFTGAPPASNPVRVAGVSAGTYGAGAVAPSGFTFVDCSSHDYHINGDGTATYTVPPGLEVTPGGTATARFYVAAVPSRPQAPTFKVTASVDLSGSVPSNTAVTYSIHVQNKGKAPASPGTVTDLLTLQNGESALVTSDATPDIGTVTGPAKGTTLMAPGASWTWDLSAVSLSHNATATLAVGIEPSNPGTIVNAAQLEHSNCFPPKVAAQCSTTTQVQNLVLTKTVDHPSTVAIGTTLKYTISLQNPTNNGAANVVLTDAMTGNAGLKVNTPFQANPTTLNNIVDCVVSDCATFTWTWPVIAGGQTAQLVYTAVIERPAQATRAATLTNTVSSANLPPAVVSNIAPVGAVLATTQPGTRGLTTGAMAELNLRLAAMLFAGGLFFVVCGVLLRRRRDSS
jgi:uncharacterized repeat protein (TIGR01451 family)